MLSVGRLVRDRSGGEVHLGEAVAVFVEQRGNALGIGRLDDQTRVVLLVMRWTISGASKLEVSGYSVRARQSTLPA